MNYDAGVEVRGNQGNLEYAQRIYHELTRVLLLQICTQGNEANNKKFETRADSLACPDTERNRKKRNEPTTNPAKNQKNSMLEIVNILAVYVATLKLRFPRSRINLSKT